ncbi:armadillo-type protein [Paraphysoderma sedebokerense]|nr:armadillo-type protein [Paraphysoderma sedebokerense]
MESQLSQAVLAALNPYADPTTRSQAINFCDQVKSSPDGWLICLNIYTSANTSSSHPVEVRFFCLQVVQDTLQSRYSELSPQHALLLRQSIVEYLNRFYSVSSSSSSSSTPSSSSSQSQSSQRQQQTDIDTPFLRNKLSQVITSLFRHLYPSDWPDFFDFLISLLPPHLFSPPSPNQQINGLNHLNGPFNPVVVRSVDLFLRICLAIDDEIANLLIQREKGQLQRNLMIKDAMRQQDIHKLVTVWYNILLHFDTSYVEILSLTLKAIAMYISWIDISLVVNPQFIPVIYRFLTPSTSSTAEYDTLRIAASQAVTEIIGKGMKPNEKLEMVRVLGVFEVLEGVCKEINDAKGTDQEDSDEYEKRLEFVEQMAKFVNVLGVELVRVWDESTDVQTKELGMQMIEKLVPFLIQFLAHEYDDVTQIVLDCTTQVLSLLKKQKRLTSSLTPSQHSILLSLLQVIIHKMKYHIDSSTSSSHSSSKSLQLNSPSASTPSTQSPISPDADDDSENEEEALFQQLRKQLNVLFDNIAVIDKDAWGNVVSSVILEILGKPESGGMQQVKWNDVELAIYLVYLFGEAVKATGTVQTAKSLLPNSNQFIDNGNPTALGQLLIRMVKSPISKYPHPLVAPIYFETIVRYVSFFECFPDSIPLALEAFIDNRGLHNPRLATRSRVNYLFYRFIKSLKDRVKPFSEECLRGIQDLLAISPPVATTPSKPTSLEKDGEKTHSPSFDNQLYLFEAVGILISVDVNPPQKQAEYLEFVITPLTQNIQTIASTHLNVQGTITPETENEWITHLCQCVTAIGSVAKGFPEVLEEFPGSSTDMSSGSGVKKTSVTASGVDRVSLSQAEPWIMVFKKALEVVLSILERCGAVEAVRDATRFTYQRILSCIGSAGLQYLSPLVSYVLTKCSTKEVSDLLSFMGLVVHKFKSTSVQHLASLFLPLIQRTFDFLNTSPTGTDDAIAINELKTRYLNFLGSLFQSGLESDILGNPTIQPHLGSLVSSIVHYALDTGDKTGQKIAINVFGKLIGSGFGSGGGEELERMVFESVARICFEMTMGSGFDVKDGKSLVIISEVSLLQKTTLSKYGPNYITYLLQVYLPGIGCPPELGQEYVNAMQNLDGKKWSDWVKNFIVSNKR